MPSEYCEYILDLLAPLRGVSSRRMFGGYGLFRAGLMFGIIIDDVLYFKTGNGNRRDYEELGAEPFRYARQGKSVALSYWNVPATVIEDENHLIDWAEKACAVARLTSGSKKSAKKRSKTVS
jgi:DNA transformation protein